MTTPTPRTGAPRPEPTRPQDAPDPESQHLIDEQREHFDAELKEKMRSLYRRLTA